ncbi:MAG: M23 family metallopeptidase [Agathobacter sp.]|nr:M23 family metallopeptidase [Agathobacter sp.]
MKKYQYIVALSCVLVGALGFGGIYAYNQAQEKQSQKEEHNIEIGSITEDLEKDEHQDEPKVVLNDEAELESDFSTEELVEIELEPQVDEEIVAELSPEEQNEAPVSKITEEVLHFQPEKGIVWPIKGSVLLDYSMDATIYFPTLQQYQYNPAMVLSGKVNDKVYFIAKGKITNIETNEVTGCTVTQDIGDGYTAIYGQLKELNFEVGDMVQSGQVVGYVSEPTKYYSVEGSNVYFQLLKNGVPVDPEEILP